MRVTILPSQKYSGRYTGQNGTIIKVYGSGRGKLYGIRLDDLYNNASIEGLFWFERRALETIQTNNNTERNEDKIMINNYVAVDVTFNGGNKVTYAWYPTDFDLHVGDLVACQTLRHGIVIAEASRIYTDPMGAPTPKRGRELLCVVPVEQYKARRACERDMQRIKAEMDKQVYQMREEAMYDMLAENNPTLKALLTQYRELQSKFNGSSAQPEEKHDVCSTYRPTYPTDMPEEKQAVCSTRRPTYPTDMPDRDASKEVANE